MSFLDCFFSPLSRSSFIETILESLCIGNRAFWSLDPYSLNNELLSEFSDSNAVAKLKDVEREAFKVFMEDLP